jgi:hypothetical protein
LASFFGLILLFRVDAGSATEGLYALRLLAALAEQGTWGFVRQFRPTLTGYAQVWKRCIKKILVNQ